MAHGFPNPSWRRGSIPRDIATLRKALPAYNGSHEKIVALSDAAEIMHDIIDCALSGDSGCGEFLAALTAALIKNKRQFDANWYFAKARRQYRSARPATRKNSALRGLIDEIIRDAQTARTWFLFTGLQTDAVAHVRREDLTSLPEFGPAEEAINAWFEIVVYPMFQLMEPVLQDHPVIGRLKKAWDSGKFHVSSLQGLIRKTMVRIAACPSTMYFDVNDIRKRGLAYK